MAKQSSGTLAVHHVAVAAQRGASSGDSKHPVINAPVTKVRTGQRHNVQVRRIRKSNPSTGNGPAPINTQKPASQPQPRTKQPRKRKQPPITIKHARPGMLDNGSSTVKLEFLIGLILIVLSPMANSAIKFDRDYVKRVIAWMLVFMLLFPLSSSSQVGLVRLANATGAVLLLVISLKGTKSGFGVDVPTLLNTIIQKIQPGGGANDIPIPPPGVTRPIPGTNSTITGPMNGNDWIIGTSSDF